jgi:antitoxin (DNA-binding transcriptional repressor) of toxin-antitoxin stability system
MSSLYTMSEARARLAQLLDEVERGVDVVITRHGRPAARLVYPRPSNPHAADLMHAVDRLMTEFDQPRERELPPVGEGGPTADELIAALRADRDAT